MPPALAFGSRSSVFKEQPCTGPQRAEVHVPELVTSDSLPAVNVPSERTRSVGLVKIAAGVALVNAHGTFFQNFTADLSAGSDEIIARSATGSHRLAEGLGIQPVNHHGLRLEKLLET